jgi:hypothetical protein
MRANGHCLGVQAYQVERMFFPAAGRLEAQTGAPVQVEQAVPAIV